MHTQDRLILLMMEHDKGHPQLIQHFLKVHHFARLIGLMEGLDAGTQQILETAAIVHDVGILPSLALYGDDAGAHQEALGPDEAEPLLNSLGYDPCVIARVRHLIAHHHTYTAIDGMDHQILVEADFLVNLFENHASFDAIRRAQETIFKTAAGRALLQTQFSL